MDHALTRFTNRNPVGFNAGDVGVGSVYFANTLAGLSRESQGLGLLKKKRKQLAPGEMIAKAQKFMAAGQRQVARSQSSAPGGNHLRIAARSLVSQALQLPGKKQLKTVPKGMRKQLKRERAQVMRAVLNPGTANAPAPVIINPTQIAPPAPMSVADNTPINAPQVEQVPGSEPIYDESAEMPADEVAYDEAGGEEWGYADEGGEYVEGDDVIVEEALEGQGMGFFNKIGKIIKRNKNTIGKIAGVASVFNPAIGGAIGTVASAAGGGGQQAARPAAAAPVKRTPAPAKRVVRKVAAPAASKISTPMVVIGGIAAVALVAGMVRK